MPREFLTFPFASHKSSELSRRAAAAEKVEEKSAATGAFKNDEGNFVDVMDLLKVESYFCALFRSLVPSLSLTLTQYVSLYI